MDQHTKTLLNQSLNLFGSALGVQDITENFEVDPRHGRQFINAVFQDSGFLSLIDNRTVEDVSGSIFELGSEEMIVTRSGVGRLEGATRQTRSVYHMGEHSEYKCESMETNVHIPYETIEDFGNEIKGFYDSWRSVVSKNKGLSFLKIGFHGEHAAVKTDPVENPMGQDVAKGWLKILEEKGRATDEIQEGTGEIRVGKWPGADFANLDDLVNSMVDEIPSPLRVDLKAVMGETLLSAERGTIYSDQGRTPSEKLLTDLKMVSQNFGMTPTLTATYFPEDAVLLTRLKNLAFITQRGSMRMHVRPNPERDQLEEFASKRSCFHVHRPEQAVMLRNIKMFAQPDKAKVDAGNFDEKNPEHWVWSTKKGAA